MLRNLCFLAVILGAKSAIAPFIKPCKVSDAECLLASARAAVPFVAPGIPELGIQPLDPLYLKTVKGDQAGLKLTFKDTTVTGMKGCSVDAIKQDMAKGKQSITIRCSVVLRGDYKLGGQLILFPVHGDGKYVIKIRDIIIKAHTEIAPVQGADGKQHWQINKWGHSFQVKTSTNFQFENLFDGNKLLADPIEKFLNSSWREVMQEVAGPIVYAIVNSVVDGVKALYKAVPIDELVIQ